MRNLERFRQSSTLSKKPSAFSTEAFIYYISIVRLTGLGTISIHEEQFQISEAGRKQSESI